MCAERKTVSVFERAILFMFVGQGYACWEKETRRKILYPYIYIYIYRGEGINRMKKAVISSGRDE